MSTGLPLAEGWLPDRPENIAWEMATLLPEQGSWSLEAYFEATDGSNRRIEYIEGRLEFLPMPTGIHQALAGFLYHALLAFNQSAKVGIVPFPPIRVRVAADRVREPDVLMLLNEHAHQQHNRAWDGADFVVEVVSGGSDDRKRDYDDKTADYARVGVAEYWIVDPKQRTVTVNRLDGSSYAAEAAAGEGQAIESTLLDGFSISVSELFAVGDAVPE